MIRMISATRDKLGHGQKPWTGANDLLTKCGAHLKVPDFLRELSRNNWPQK